MSGQDLSEIRHFVLDLDGTRYMDDRVFDDDSTPEIDLEPTTYDSVVAASREGRPLTVEKLY